jgi:RimJ/RimL family protein N-acetyltransferase
VIRLEASIHPEHVASQRVAARIGLLPTDTLVDGVKSVGSRHGRHSRTLALRREKPIYCEDVPIGVPNGTV